MITRLPFPKKNPVTSNTYLTRFTFCVDGSELPSFSEQGGQFEWRTELVCRRGSYTVLCHGRGANSPALEQQTTETMLSQYPAHAHNFRDLGGIVALDGRRVRNGLVFRSGDMGDLETECEARIRALDIRAIIDLRSRNERLRRPYSWRQALGISSWEDVSEQSALGIAELVSSAESGVEDVADRMIELYRTLPYSHAQSYATLFRWIADGRVPIVFNCAAGKDRTGVGAALLLLALGVSYEEILADYMRSDDAIAGLRQMIVNDRGWDISALKVQAVLSSRPDYLSAMFEALHARSGGAIGYFSEIGLSEPVLEKVRAQLLV